MLSRRHVIATTAALALAGPAEAHHLTWRRFFRIPKPLDRIRVINVPANGRVTVADGRGDEDALLVLPNAAMTGRVKLVGFRGIYCIGGVVDPAGDGWMYTPVGTLVWGMGDTFWFQTAAQAVSRPFVYMARLRVLSSRIVYGDHLRVGGAAAVGSWDMWPDVYRHLLVVDPLYGWPPSRTAQYGEPPAPAHHGSISHSDLIKQDPGGCRHMYTGAVQCAWGFQQEFLPPPWSTEFREYRGQEGRAVRHYWDYLAVPLRKPAIGLNRLPTVFTTVRDDTAALSGNYDLMHFHGPGELEGKGVWIQPEPGVTDFRPYAVLPDPELHLERFAPVQTNNQLSWPQTDWAEGMPAYRGVVHVSETPPSVVPESKVGLAWRVTSKAALKAYHDNHGHLN